MKAVDPAGKGPDGDARPEPKKVLVVLKTTPRELAGALLALRTSPARPAPLALDVCPLDPGLP